MSTLRERIKGIPEGALDTDATFNFQEGYTKEKTKNEHLAKKITTYKKTMKEQSIKLTVIKNCKSLSFTPEQIEVAKRLFMKEMNGDTLGTQHCASVIELYKKFDAINNK